MGAKLYFDLSESREFATSYTLNKKSFKCQNCIYHLSIYYPFDSDEDSDGEDVGGDAEQAGEGGPHPHHGEQLRRRRHGPRQVGRQGRVEGRHQLGGSHRHG